MNIYEKLLNIQNELKAPKNQYNSFGNYKYRSCEDILEAVKPICSKNKAVLHVPDEIVEIGGKIYVKATATLTNVEETKESIVNTAYARESDTKKGMDDSQITGTASSYARKYALNGLFCIDDTKDADTNEYAKRITAKTDTDESLNGKVTEIEAKTVYAIMTKKGLNVVEQLKANYGVSNTKDLTKEQYASILKAIKDLPDKE